MGASCVLLGCLQVDNHLPAALYPVLVSGMEEAGDDGSGKRPSEPTPFLEVSVIKEVNEATNTDHFDYVAFRWVDPLSRKRVGSLVHACRADRCCWAWVAHLTVS